MFMGQMKRRAFVGLCAMASFLVLAAATDTRAQGQNRQRVGLLLGAYAEDDRAGQARIKVFRDSMRALGWSENGNIQLDIRWGNGNIDRTKILAAELAESRPSAIVVSGDPALADLRRLTKEIPIIFTQVSDPVDSGFVRSLARPEGNITGFQNFEPEMGGKWLGLLKEAVPTVRSVYTLAHTGTAPHVGFQRTAEAAAQAVGVTLAPLNVRNADEIDQIITMLAREPDAGAIVFPHPNTIANRKLINALALQHRIPMIYPYRYFATDGGLMSYGPDQIDQWRGAAVYVDRILHGEKVSNLPVQTPVKYELVFNLQTAKSLGLDIPAWLRARADELIE
jgi:putative tryptophan/tyrosine transport system substrate-binding protein